MLRDFLIAIALANLCFIKVWPEILNDVSAEPYYLKTPLSTIVVPLMFAVVVLAGMMWVGAISARRSRRGWVLNLARWTFLLVLVVPLNGVRTSFPGFYLSSLMTILGQVGTLLAAAVLCAFAAMALARWYRSIVHVAANLVLITSPFVLYTFSQAVWPLVQRAGVHAADKPPASTLTRRRNPRILWLVFDEMDQYVTFEGRPATVELPEIDRFRQEAIYATRVRSPAIMTKESMPAVITGKLVSTAEPAGPNELMITFQGASNPVPWSGVPNVFSKARDAGVNTALAGWYHPYCRILGRDLRSCYWEPYEAKYGIRSGKTWFERINWIPMLINTIPLAERLSLTKHLESAIAMKLPNTEPKRERQESAIRSYLSMLRHAENIVTDPAFGLTLIHWPIPHPPGLYNRFKKDLAWDARGEYVDNLELVDQTLGRLRRQMQRANLWDSSIVLITSDHPYRAEGHLGGPSQTIEKTWDPFDDEVGRNIPFLLKLPGQKETVTYDRPFNSVVIPDLFMAFLHRELSDPKQVVDWLNARNK